MSNIHNVNVDEVRALADFLEALPLANFNLGDWGREMHDTVPTHCGTVACVAGWQAVRVAERYGITQLFHDEAVNFRALHRAANNPDYAAVASTARASLNLSYPHSELLFYMRDGASPYFYAKYGGASFNARDVTPAMAARALRAYAADPDGVFEECDQYTDCEHDEIRSFVRIAVEGA